MISFNEIKKGVQILDNNQPYLVLEANHLKKAQRRPVIQTRLRNLITGEIISKNFHQDDVLEEPQLETFEAKFLYHHRDKYVFCRKENPSVRFEFTKEKLGETVNFLRPNLEVKALVFNGEIINISLPIKVELKVVEAPPALKGDSAQSPTKFVILESGYRLQAPIFIKAGDIVQVNTENGEYVRRVKEAE